MHTNATAARIPRHQNDHHTPAPAVPRDRGDDYTVDMALRRREFVREQTGASLKHVGKLLVRPRRIARKHRELHRRRAGADRRGRSVADQRRARPGRLLCPAGHHRGHARRQLQPWHARAQRMRRRQDDRRRGQHAARSGVHLRRRLQAREFGAWIDQHEEEIRAAAEATTRSGKLTYIGQYQVGPCSTCASTSRRAMPPART